LFSATRANGINLFNRLKFNDVNFLNSLTNFFMDSQETELDAYLKDSEKKSRRKKSKQQKSPEKKPPVITDFIRWRASAANDFFKGYVLLLFLLMAGGTCLLTDVLFARYFFYAAGVAGIFSLIWCSFDFWHYKKWHSQLKFNLEGWKQAINGRSRKFWLVNGEYWVSTRIVIVLREPVNEKHRKVSAVFLEKLRKRLNKWTVSSEPRHGYPDPNGWSTDGLILTGDMNARVSNLVRKKLSGEFNKLAALMSGSIDKIIITCSGGEKHHEVFDDSD
jgi:hypothetical protein